MTPEETTSNNFNKPGLILEHCNLMIPLSAGYSNNVKIYRNVNSLLILIAYMHLAFVGLDEVDFLDGEIIGTVFLQVYQLKESVSKNLHLMKPEKLIKLLNDYL